MKRRIPIGRVGVAGVEEEPGVELEVERGVEGEGMEGEEEEEEVRNVDIGEITARVMVGDQGATGKKSGKSKFC